MQARRSSLGALVFWSTQIGWKTAKGELGTERRLKEKRETTEGDREDLANEGSNDGSGFPICSGPAWYDEKSKASPSEIN